MRLRVMSYNIHRAIGVDRRFRPERIARIIKHHEPDILLLQEVDVGVPRSRHLDLAEELAALCDYPHRAVGLNVALSKGHYGNATLSRFPITSQRNIDLTLPKHKARGCLYTALEVPVSGGSPRSLAVFNLHLGLSFHERPQQVGNLVKTPEFTTLGPEEPCVVGGDFNDWFTRLAPMFTEIMGFKCASSHKENFQSPYLTYPSFSPTGGLDKIFVRGPFEIVKRQRCRMQISKIASDHLPVLADLDW
ncbi:endonuclease/exonuclease/phosphatase family protein [Desulfurivibrio dismutans]|uniref:endonuclease/exonuclease/phosphatase family protein n=1 Tax=Desulfurivibrio dismutans TaxID=1398908 RepID=UPI0023DC418D|nr:endonuclease/exonuclease/phosphatase family protein [Desulfurivibrio alkaliphilus]MDF1615115.1 endonuclease/exonuclease/phosphatase family protein [Desulfurivibrio alkaliphilus]